MATTKKLIKEAKTEYEQTGTLTTVTYMELNNNGINADILLAQFEADKDGEG